jgi:adenylate cyclase
VAKLYSAFVRAMTRCASYFGGEVRGIIGDRVMVLFQPDKCFENAIDAAELMNTVCAYVINRQFVHNDVEFGIGIDYGRMLATKTGIRRHGNAQPSYRSLVWLGRPANVASKLTDQANKPQVSRKLTKLRVAYNYNGQLIYRDEYPHTFVQSFTWNPGSGLMHHYDPAFHSFTTFTEEYIERSDTPSILMTKAVYDGFRAARPDAIELQKKWFYPISIELSDYNGQIYGGDIIYKVFRDG